MILTSPLTAHSLHRSLITIYNSVVYSKLDHGSVVYGSETKSYFSKLDPLAYAAVRLSLSTFCTFNISSLQALSGEPLLRCQKVCLL